MRKTIFLPVVLLFGLALIGLHLLTAAEKTITLPKGTSVEKLGTGNFRFVLPNGQRVEIKGYQARAGIIGDCGVYDKGKLTMKGGRGNLIGVVAPDPPSIIKASKENTFVVFRGELASMKTLAKVPHSEYVMIDDEVTWLPATIQFKPAAAGKTGTALQTAKTGTATFILPKGTTARKVGVGHFRFSLPNGQAVEVNQYNVKTGIIGDTGVYDKGKLMIKGGGGSLTGVVDPDPPSIIRAARENTCVIGSELISLKTLAKVPHSSYVMIDDEVTWLPATIRFN
jgi:hypothetical protein